MGERRLGEGRIRNWGERAEGRLGTLESRAEAEGSMVRPQAEVATPPPLPPASAPQRAAGSGVPGVRGLVLGAVW